MNERQKRKRANLALKNLSIRAMLKLKISGQLESAEYYEWLRIYRDVCAEELMEFKEEYTYDPEKN